MRAETVASICTVSVTPRNWPFPRTAFNRADSSLRRGVWATGGRKIWRRSKFAAELGCNATYRCLVRRGQATHTSRRMGCSIRRVSILCRVFEYTDRPAIYGCTRSRNFFELLAPFTRRRWKLRRRVVQLGQSQGKLAAVAVFGRRTSSNSFLSSGRSVRSVRTAWSAPPSAMPRATCMIG